MLRAPLTRLLVTIGFATLASACAATTAVPRPFPMPARAALPPDSGAGLREIGSPSPTPDHAPGTEAGWYALVGTALDLRGIPYKNGGADSDGFDCSGFTQYVFARHGMMLPRDVRDQFRVGEPVQDDVAPGDLLFFTTADSAASHVAIAVADDQFVHAPSASGVVRVERLSASYWAQRFLGARRVRLP